MSTPTPNTVAVHSPEAPLQTLDFSTAQLDLIRKTIAVGCTPAEFDLFIEVCRAAALNPFLRQIYALKLEGKLVVHVGIDGLRAIAQRSGQYGGSGRPLFGGPRPARWDQRLTVPEDCEMTVWRLVPGGGSVRVVGYARFDEFARTVRDRASGQIRLMKMWADMPYNQLAKVTEAQALRKGFQHEMETTFQRIQAIGAALDLRGDLGEDDRPEALGEGAQAALEPGPAHAAGARVEMPRHTAETVATMTRAAAPDPQAADHAAREAKVRTQFRRDEARQGAAPAADPRAAAWGRLWQVWTAAGLPKAQAARLAKTAEFGFQVTSWNDLTAVALGELADRVEEVRTREQAEAVPPPADDDGYADAVVDQAEREPGDEAPAQAHLIPPTRRTGV